MTGVMLDVDEKETPEEAAKRAAALSALSEAMRMEQISKQKALGELRKFLKTTEVVTVET